MYILRPLRVFGPRVCRMTSSVAHLMLIQHAARSPSLTKYALRT